MAVGRGVGVGVRVGGFIHSFSHPLCDSLEVSHLAAPRLFVCAPRPGSHVKVRSHCPPALI